MNVKKLLIAVLVPALFFILFPINAIAFDEKYYTDKIDIQQIINSLPESAKQYVPSDIFSSDNISEIPSKIDSETLRDYTLNVVQRLSKNTLTNLVSLLIIIVLISLINTSKNTLASDSFQKGIEYITTLVLSVYTYQIISRSLAFLSDFLKVLDVLINALIPIMAMLYSLGGNVSSAVVSTSGISLAITATNYAVQHIFLPSIKVCYGLILASRISGIKGISHIEKTIRNFLTTTLVGTTTLFSVFLIFKTNISVASDSLAARTIRFAGSFIPVIGSPLGESVRTVMTGVSMIKSSVGFVGIYILLITTLPTVIQVIITKFTFDITATLSYVLGNEKEGDFLKNISSIFNFLIAVTVTICVLFLLELTVFVFVSPALGG